MDVIEQLHTIAAVVADHHDGSLTNVVLSVPPSVLSHIGDARIDFGSGFSMLASGIGLRHADDIDEPDQVDAFYDVPASYRSDGELPGDAVVAYIAPPALASTVIPQYWRLREQGVGILASVILLNANPADIRSSRVYQLVDQIDDAVIAHAHTYGADVEEVLVGVHPGLFARVQWDLVNDGPVEGCTPRTLRRVQWDLETHVNEFEVFHEAAASTDGKTGFVFRSTRLGVVPPRVGRSAAAEHRLRQSASGVAA